MQIESKRLNLHNKFMVDYLKGEHQLLSHFDYNPIDSNLFHDRLKDINKGAAERHRLTEVLLQLNKKWHASESSIDNIERLREQNSVVVIGGQQAGILTGPLYTINKIISIIALAKEQEEQLQVPVLPVFWIAGEDHDFDEVNHIFMPEHTSLQKWKIDSTHGEKVSVSNRDLDQEKVKKWMTSVFSLLQETSYTKGLYQLLLDQLAESETYVDFFALVIHQLFADSGLILVDSGAKELRQLEADFFKELIEKQPSISRHTYRSLQSMRKKGYYVSVDVKETDAHLFVEENGERILLQRNNDNWHGKNDECSYSQKQLLEIAANQPERLSNNVVTRPLMQEKLFPTLAFFAGPSEAAYWSILKEAFHDVSLKMPPVLPRVSLTILEQKTEKWLDRMELEPSAVINNGVQVEKQHWLAAQTQQPITDLTEQFKAVVAKTHLPFREIADSLGDDVSQYADKNLRLICYQIDQMANRLEKEFKQKYSTQLQLFDLIDLQLHPQGGLQERIWNLIYFLNYYGMDWLKELQHSQLDWQQQHYIVRI
ncbi:bacillithiol biosynthesis cysteine-adding enzyme BshC [Gracilibacillus alcaliphilus]|uniref:bacillithiol biosynthesis cysteine-adding enzyme BshC n=1 Tax=Gracilibacillus alcaliphilus TaxID=1401441 RepID=UPI001959F15D|nr:bacillithiol biosynthesis cysteine-adding enzyme BshC [Gracilibacillus alcaliphilus]MBM7678631.1 bacillithiol biosynthesis cysteine-adding enzyme BshC [Gracilibacillus alcaliphilus]